MSYDLYATFQCESQNDVDAVVKNDTIDVATRIRLLAAAVTGPSRDYARVGDRRRGGGYKSLVDNPWRPTDTLYTSQLIAVERDQRLRPLGLWQPAVPDFALLPPFSALLQFQFTLARPYLSRDDETFHINDNPVRKDKVFKVPMVAGTSWKGNLRWTAIKLLVDDWHLHGDVQTFAKRRLQLTLLFGDEKGEEPSDPKDLARYLRDLSRDADAIYREMIRAHFPGRAEGVPHHAGRLRFFPTFFDRIGLEVINPHDQKTRAGKQPIYFESVPIGATGFFSLLYVPVDNVGVDEARSDMALVADAISAMMLTYGFSAKKSSGFGEARAEIRGSIWTSAGRWSLTGLQNLSAEACSV